tara:strand:+ start:41 stop:475 length:435 start_codon:yes stop_codon:yes gene_type:complete
MKAIFILEGKLNENDQYQLSKDVEQLAKDWGLSSYLDDVLEDDVCEHNNTITNECSDCNEQERKDYTDTSVDDDNPTNIKGAILEHLLPEIRNLIIDYNLRDKIYDIAGQWSKSSYKMLQDGLDDEIVDSIFKAISVKSMMENK